MADAVTSLTVVRPDLTEATGIGKRPQFLEAPAPAPAAQGESAFDLAEATDRDAVSRTLTGETEAFAGVVRRHGGKLVTLCARMVGSRQVGEELAQEALARAYSGLGSWHGNCRFRHWLSRVAVNCCRDYLKSGVRSERPADLTGDEITTTRDPESDAVGRELIRALEAAIARLPLKYREAFLLFHVENLEYEEIGTITGTSIGALKVRVHRARMMLRDALGEKLEGI
jgi:RNA polymerase sigma-70 factor, ECF subfamily